VSVLEKNTAEQLKKAHDLITKEQKVRYHRSQDSAKQAASLHQYCRLTWSWRMSVIVGIQVS
jgi:hypothetical protein